MKNSKRGQVIPGCGPVYHSPWTSLARAGQCPTGGGSLYHTRTQVKADAFDDIGRFHNLTRWHFTLGYLSPMEIERQAE